jgi:hypothetical protein
MTSIAPQTTDENQQSREHVAIQRVMVQPERADV